MCAIHFYYHWWPILQHHLCNIPVWLCYQTRSYYNGLLWCVIGSCPVWVINAVLGRAEMKSCHLSGCCFCRVFGSLSCVYSTLLLALSRRLYSRLHSVGWMMCIPCRPHFHLAQRAPAENHTLVSSQWTKRLVCSQDIPRAWLIDRLKNTEFLQFAASIKL